MCTLCWSGQMGGCHCCQDQSWSLRDFGGFPLPFACFVNDMLHPAHRICQRISFYAISMGMTSGYQKERRIMLRLRNTHTSGYESQTYSYKQRNWYGLDNVECILFCCLDNSWVPDGAHLFRVVLPLCKAITWEFWQSRIFATFMSAHGSILAL